MERSECCGRDLSNPTKAVLQQQRMRKVRIVDRWARSRLCSCLCDNGRRCAALRCGSGK